MRSEHLWRQIWSSPERRTAWLLSLVLLCIPLALEVFIFVKALLTTDFQSDAILFAAVLLGPLFVLACFDALALVFIFWLRPHATRLLAASLIIGCPLFIVWFGLPWILFNAAGGEGNVWGANRQFALGFLSGALIYLLPKYLARAEQKKLMQLR